MGTRGVKPFQLLALLLPLLAACGQVRPLGMPYLRSVDASVLRGVHLAQDETNGSCRYNDAITPDQDRWLDGSGYYSVCASEDDSTRVTLFGLVPEGSRRYCVFPAEVASNGVLYPKVDASSLPIYQCSSGSVQDPTIGQSFTFANTNYNAAFVTTYEARLQMQICLGSGDYFSCPDFSYGQFRFD